jgi:hypothetical protein
MIVDLRIKAAAPARPVGDPEIPMSEDADARHRRRYNMSSGTLDGASELASEKSIVRALGNRATRELSGPWYHSAASGPNTSP